MIRIFFILVFALSFNAVSAQRTVTFKVRKTVPLSETRPFATSVDDFEELSEGFSVGVLCGWLKKAGFTLQNEDLEGGRLAVESFEFAFNSKVPLLGIHKMHEPYQMYQDLLRFNYSQVGDRLYIGWLKVRTPDGEVIKLPDMKFVKES